MITLAFMVLRWSRLALAAILAFGAGPGLAAAAASERGSAATCCRDLEPGAGPSLVAAVVADSFHRCHGARQATPLCAPASAATPPSRTVVVQLAEPSPAEHEPGSREASWRLAPKTSPPRPSTRGPIAAR